MNLTLFFGLLGGLLVLAFVANRLVRRTGIPDVLVLMATGVLLGPILQLVDPSKFASVTHGFGTLALILILFEAGLELDLWQALRHFPGGFLLAVFSYAFSMLLIAACGTAAARAQAPVDDEDASPAQRIRGPLNVSTLTLGGMSIGVRTAGRAGCISSASRWPIRRRW